MVSLEMIGFTKPGPDVFIGSENDYLGMAGDPPSEYLARVFGAAAFTYNNFFFAPAVSHWPSWVPFVTHWPDATLRAPSVPGRSTITGVTARGSS